MRIPHSILREDIAVQDFLGSGAHGPVYADARDVRARVEPTSRLFTDDQGRVLTITLLASIRPEAGPVPPESRVAWAGRTYRVVTAAAMPDTRRPDHYELALARFAG